MSRKIKERYDKGEYLPLAPLPAWMMPSHDKQSLPGAREAISDYGVDLLVSRAKYISSYGLERHDDRLKQLIAADEISNMDRKDLWVDAMYSIYPEDGLDPDELLEAPSSDVRVRAKLLNSFLQKYLKELRVPPHVLKDLNIILSIFKIQPDQNKAYAQRLLIDNPEVSLREISRISTQNNGLRFGQSCLSQWLSAGIVIDIHSNTRPRA